MKSNIFQLITVAVILIVFGSACGKEDLESHVTMIVKTGYAEVYKATKILLAGSGTVSIDWGDGTDSEKHMLSAYNDIDWVMSESLFLCYHEYPKASTYTITMNGGNITHLQCWNGGMSSLDVSGMTQLKRLDCGLNPISSLDVRKNTKLESLSCGHNWLLTNLVVSDNPELISVICESCPISHLDLSKSTKLSFLNCRDTKLINFDISKNLNLEFLDCADMNLTGLDVSKNTKLTTLICRSNQLTSLNVSTNTVLHSLYCGYNLFTAEKLDDLFKTLHRNAEGRRKYIEIDENPGTDDCNRSIAIEKGWHFDLYDIW